MTLCLINSVIRQQITDRLFAFAAWSICSRGQFGPRRRALAPTAPLTRFYARAADSSESINTDIRTLHAGRRRHREEAEVGSVCAASHTCPLSDGGELIRPRRTASSERRQLGSALAALSGPEPVTGPRHATRPTLRPGQARGRAPDPARAETPGDGRRRHTSRSRSPRPAGGPPRLYRSNDRTVGRRTRAETGRPALLAL